MKQPAQEDRYWYASQRRRKDGRGYEVLVGGRVVNRKRLTKEQAISACARIISGQGIAVALRRARETS